VNTDNVRATAMSRNPVAALAAGAALVTATVCTSCTASKSSSATTPPEAPTTSAVSSTPSPPPAETAKQHATSAYLGMWDDFVAAAATSDWRSPKLGQYATGVALSTLSRGLYADHYNGLVSRGAPTHAAEVSSVDPPANPTTAVIADCSDSTNALKYRADNGQPANDGPGGRRSIHATVQKQSDGSWKVSDFGVQGIGTC
jgi:hypothetical protein